MYFKKVKPSVVFEEKERGVWRETARGDDPKAIYEMLVNNLVAKYLFNSPTVTNITTKHLTDDWFELVVYHNDDTRYRCRVKL